MKNFARNQLSLATIPFLGQALNKSENVKSNEYKSIRYLNLFRLLLSFFFFSIIFKDVGGFVGIKYAHDVAKFIASFYLGFAIIIWIVSVFYTRRRITIGLVALVIDLPFIISLTILFGGLYNGWSILAVITIGSFSIISHRAWSIFAMPIIAVSLLFILPPFLGVTTYSITFASAILYALTYFAIAFVGISQSRSYNKSLLLTKLQRSKITNLSKLNDLIVDKMEAGVVAYDEKYLVVLINKKAMEIVKTNVGQLLPPKLIDKITSLQNSKTANINIYAEDVFINITRASTPERVSLLFMEKQADINNKSQQINLATIGQLSATIAHELRNPMSAIYSAAQLLQESDSINQEDIELTTIIAKQIERSDKIIEDILMMSKPHIAEQSRINISVKLNKFKQEFCQQKSIDSEHMKTIVDDADLSIKFDNAHLHQLLWNLTENAFKHGTDGRMMIEVHNQTQSILIDFVNNGPAFKPIVEESLFTPFFTTHTQGTGLGLYICQELCKSNNAKLEYLRPELQHIFRIHVKK